MIQHHFHATGLLVLMICSSSLATHAQQIRGSVQDATTLSPLPYVNIGLVGLGIGTVSDEKGNYQLDVNDLPDEAVVRYSILGYESVDASVSAIRSDPSLARDIRLHAISLDLPQITVNPKDYKERRVGNELVKPNFNAGFYYNDLGNELGTMVRIKSRPAFIDQVNLHLAWCKYDTIFYRLNIYRVENGEPAERLYSSILIIDYRDQQGKDIHVDISDRPILVEDDFLVSLELIRELGEGGLMFCAGLFRDKTWYRKTSQATWESANVGIGISVDIRQETN